LSGPRRRLGLAVVVLGVLATPAAGAAQDADAQSADTRAGHADAGGLDGAPEVSVDGGVGDGVPAGAAVVPVPPPGPRAPVQGTVFARGGHRRLPAAIVYVDGLAVAETDAKGRFAVMVAPGRHRLQVTAPVHVAADVAIDVPAEGWSGEVRLTVGGSMQETVVAGKRAVAAVRVGGEEARTTPGTGGDPFRVIESLPGVSQVIWPFALYAIRGGNPGNTGFFLDGMRVPALFHFALGPSIVHPYLIDKLSFYPGGYPTRLGGYVSGAIAAESVAPPPDTTRFAADVRFYDAGGLAAAPWDGGRGTVVVAARYSYTGLVVSRLFGNVSFGYADYQLRADHTFAGGRLTLLTLGSFDQLDIRDQSIGDASLNFHRQDLRWERAVAGGLLFMRATSSIDDAHSQLYDSPLDVRSYGLASRVAYSRPLGSAVVVEVGTDSEAQRFRTDIGGVAGALSATSTPAPQPQFFGDLARSRDALTAAAYVAASIGWRRLALDPGLRYAHYFEQGTTRGALQPRLAARIGLTQRLSADATVGRFAQMPSLPIGVGGFEAFGLRDFGLQTSTQAALSLEARLAADVTLRVTGFHQWLYVSDLRSTIARDVREPEFLQMRHGRRADAAAAAAGARSRLAGVYAVVEHARLRRHRGAVGLGPAPHRQPGDDGAHRQRLLGGRPVPLQQRPPLSGADAARDGRVPAAAVVLADRPARRQAHGLRSLHARHLRRARQRDADPASHGVRARRRDQHAAARDRLPHRPAVPRHPR
jgi:hypothetical protein